MSGIEFLEELKEYLATERVSQRYWNHVFFAMSRESRRLDDRIRRLCAEVTASTDPDELALMLPELKSAIHEAIERLRIRAVAILGGYRDFPPDRRKLP
jgi:hypothetical protein